MPVISCTASLPALAGLMVQGTVCNVSSSLTQLSVPLTNGIWDTSAATLLTTLRVGLWCVLTRWLVVTLPVSFSKEFTWLRLMITTVIGLASAVVERIAFIICAKAIQSGASHFLERSSLSLSHKRGRTVICVGAWRRVCLKTILDSKYGREAGIVEFSRRFANYLQFSLDRRKAVDDLLRRRHEESQSLSGSEEGRCS